MTPLAAAAAGAAAFLLSYAIGLGIRRHAAGLRLVDVPNARSSHDRPTPRGGGVGIAAATLLGLALFGAGVPARALWAMIGGGLATATIGLADDRRSRSIGVRMLVHFAAASLVVALVGPVRMIALSGIFHVDLGALGIPLTILWIVGVINAYNFMDGIDGIAAGQGIVAGAGWLWVAARFAVPGIDVAALLIVSSTAGFLIHNFPPARLFLGDVGSGFLGFVLAALTVVAARTEPALLLAGPLFMWPFLLDAGVTLLARILRGENVLAAHRSHLYQRLVIGGWSHAAVALIYTAAAALGLVAAAVLLAAHGAHPL